MSLMVEETMLRYVFLTHGGYPVRPPPNTRLIIYASGRFKIMIPNPVPVGVRWVECEIVSQLPPPFKQKRSGRVSVATAMAFLEGLAVGGDFEVGTEPSNDPREMIYVLRQRRWNAALRRRGPLETGPPEVRPPTLTDDPLKILQHEIWWVDDIAGVIATRLTTGTTRRAGAGLRYLWQAMLLPEAELAKFLGHGVYFREFKALAAKLGVPLGGPLPAGDYPWNKSG